jgi:hypothetical protein
LNLRPTDYETEGEEKSWRNRRVGVEARVTTTDIYGLDREGDGTDSVTIRVIPAPMRDRVLPKPEVALPAADMAAR